MRKNGKSAAIGGNSSGVTGLLSIMQHGLQQYVNHMTYSESEDRMRSLMLPLNR